MNSVNMIDRSEGLGARFQPGCVIEEGGEPQPILRAICGWAELYVTRRAARPILRSLLL
jgi:hypothetical protein